MSTNFAVPGNNVSTTVGTAYSGTGAFPKSLVLATGGGALFPAITGSQTITITVCQVAFAYSPTATASNYTIYSVTGRSGDTLTLGGTLENTSDRPYAVGDIVEVRVTAGTLSTVYTAVNNIESGSSSGNVGLGVTISGGTANSVLFVDGSAHLAQDNSRFSYATASGLSLSNSSATPLSVSITATSPGPVTATFYRTNSGSNNVIAFGSSYDLASATNPYWSMGLLVGAGDFTFASYDSTNGTKTWINLSATTHGMSLGWTQSVSIDSSGYLSILHGSGAPGGSPTDGSLYLDTTNLKLYGRCGGAWKSVTLA